MNIFDLLYVFYLFSVGASISLFFVSNIWRSMIKDEDAIEEIFVDYLDKYKLDHLKVRDCDANVKNIVIEHTPNNGLIIMRYSNKNEGFEYWSNNKNIPFKVLKTVCRKYCLTFDAKNLYVDSKEMFKKQKSIYDEKIKKDLEKIKNDEKEDDLDDNSVFVKPKISKKTKLKKFIPNWLENKFINRGKISDSPLIEKTLKKNEVKLSFSDFKKIMKSD